MNRPICHALVATFLVVEAGGLSAQDRGAYLGHPSWPEAEARLAEAPLVVVPFGAGAKEHGPHLPMRR